MQFSIVEDLKNQLQEKIKQVEATEKGNEDLRSDIEYLKTENSSLKSLLEKAEKEVETERAKVDTLCDEMANLVENSVSFLINIIILLDCIKSEFLNFIFSSFKEK